MNKRENVPVTSVSTPNQQTSENNTRLVIMQPTLLDKPFSHKSGTWAILWQDSRIEIKNNFLVAGPEEFSSSEFETQTSLQWYVELRL